MPTPSQQNLRPRTPEDTTTPSQSSFASCPPDEEREQHARGSERVGIRESTINSAATETSEAESVEHARVIMQQPTPEPESESSVGSHRIPSPLEPEKAETIEDAGVLVDPASPTVGTPDTANDGDAHLVQSMLSTDISELSPASPLPQYLHFPELDVGRTTSPNSTSSFLRPGSKFKGTQQSDRQVYEVQVELKDVNLAESFLCGYLRIQGLTDDHPTLTTFFEGEIVGPKYLFKTQHPSWGSNEKVDLQHWARFPAWRPLAKSAKSPNFALKNNLDREHLFMRWKEYFLVPDHRVKTITGASFEGFYYICFNQCSGSVSGIYFHAKSEKYQRLELQHVDDRGCMPAMEFR